MQPTFAYLHLCLMPGPVRSRKLSAVSRGSPFLITLESVVAREFDSSALPCSLVRFARLLRSRLNAESKLSRVKLHPVSVRISRTCERSYPRRRISSTGSSTAAKRAVIDFCRQSAARSRRRRSSSPSDTGVSGCSPPALTLPALSISPAPPLRLIGSNFATQAHDECMESARRMHANPT